MKELVLALVFTGVVPVVARGYRGHVADGRLESVRSGDPVGGPHRNRPGGLSTLARQAATSHHG